ncbi:MAG: flagellar protein [Helicobacter sp.]|nr:flagellar protein [Helicobacter sp.]
MSTDLKKHKKYKNKNAIKIAAAMFGVAISFGMDESLDAKIKAAQNAPSPLKPAQNNESQNVLSCNIIFENRKSEIIHQLNQLFEKESSIKALERANKDLFEQKESKIKLQEDDLSKKIADFNAKKSQEEALAKARLDEISQKLAQNEKILKEIQDAAQSKLAQTYAKMKDAKAAAIINDLDLYEAAQILFYLKPQEIGKILSKMDTKKAAVLTDILKKGPPFKREQSAKEPAKTPEQPLI